MDVCTIAGVNYLAFVRALAESLARVRPGSRLTVLLLDDVEGAVSGTDTLEVVRPEDLDLAPGEFHRMAAIYDVTELSTAVKPWLLQHLLARGARTVAYLDPDILLYGDLAEAERLAGTNAMVLTPHVMAPLPGGGGGAVGEEVMLMSGGFNLGFIAVGPTSGPFLDWWKARLSRHCLHDVANNLFVDQRWIDRAIHYFPHAVIRDPGYNVAYWNLAQRAVTEAEGAFLVDGRPLVFYHFSGYDPRHPDRLNKYYADFDTAESIPPAVRRLCDDYRARLFDLGYRELRDRGYGFARSVTGINLNPYLRRLYRRDLLAGQALPDPFLPADGEAFAAWALPLRLEQRAREIGHRWLRLLFRLLTVPAYRLTHLAARLASLPARRAAGSAEPPL